MTRVSLCTGMTPTAMIGVATISCSKIANGVQLEEHTLNTGRYGAAQACIDEGQRSLFQVIPGSYPDEVSCNLTTAYDYLSGGSPYDKRTCYEGPGGCEYDSEGKLHEAYQPVLDKLVGCPTAEDQKKCQCDCYDELIAFYQEEVADKCDGDLKTLAESAVTTIETLHKSMECASTTPSYTTTWAPPSYNTTWAPPPTPAPPSNASCFTLHMHDSYGDGWNGNKFVVWNCSGVQLEEHTLNNGRYGAAQVCIDETQPLIFKVFPGSYLDAS